MPWVDRPIAGLTYRHLGFSHPAGNWNGNSEVRKDYFQSATASLLWMPLDQMRMTLSVPIRQHTREETLRTTTLNGIGDLRLDADWNAWRSNNGFWLRIGGGLSAPTGMYMQRDETLKQLPATFQLGRGAWGAAARLTTAMTLNRWTLVATSDRISWGANEQGHEAGAQWRSGVHGFYRVARKHAVWLPSLGVQYEQWQADRDRGTPLPDTQGSRWVARGALALQHDRQLLTIAVEQTLGQRLADDAPALHTGLEVSWAWQWSGATTKSQSEERFL